MADDGATAAPVFDVTIVICTLDRPVLLQKAIASCLGQITKLAFELIVVDNSITGSAAATVEAMAQGRRAVRYVPVPRPNISIARNTGLAHARGEFVAFLDDDEEASPRWLDDLVTTIRAARADCAFGPVRPVFDADGPPSWDPAAWRFTRDLGLPSGTEVDLTSKPGSSARGIGTGNSLISRRVCAAEGGAFDPRFGRSGGEDSYFFLRLAQRGGRIVWCGTADVLEAVSRDRASLAYMLRRATHGSRLFVTIERQLSRRRSVLTGLLMIRGIGQILVWFAGLIVGYLVYRPVVVRARFGLAAGIGKLTWWKIRLDPAYGAAATQGDHYR